MAMTPLKHSRQRIRVSSATYVALLVVILCMSWGISDRSSRLHVARSLQPNGCRHNLSVAAHGDAETDARGVLQLETYFIKHPNVAGLILLKHAGVLRPTLRLYNVGNRAASAHHTFESKLAYSKSAGAVMNALLDIAVNELKACAVWEVDVNSTMTNDLHLGDMQSHLRPHRQPQGQGTSYYAVRPREQSTNRMSVINAYPLFSPTSYYAPRGYPAERVREDQRGEGNSAPELVRASLTSADDVIVIQSSIDGVPDTIDSVYMPFHLHHEPYLSAVILPSGTLHPYNRLATMHTYEALWALFAPVSVPFDISDIVRGYLAQAIFPLIGKYMAVVRPVLSRDRALPGVHKHTETLDAVVNHAAEWSQHAQVKCMHEPKHQDCQDAGTLMIALYKGLAGKGTLSKLDAHGAKRWIAALRANDYRFPRRLSQPVDIVRSPKRPHQLNMHAVVQLNWANQFAGILPIWHALHAAEYKQVTYHISRRADLKHPSPTIGIFPHITFVLDDRPKDRVSGIRSYECVIKAWSVHDPTTEALLYIQDDAFADTSFLVQWLQNTSSCVTMTGKRGGKWEVGSGGVGEIGDDLPLNLSDWRHQAWSWARYPEHQLAMKHFLDHIDSNKDAFTCAGPNMTSGNFLWALSEAVAVRTTCQGAKPQILFDLLQAAVDSNLWLELAWPLSVRCAFRKDEIYHYGLYTTWNEQRNNENATWHAYLTRQHDVFHPVKLTSALMTRLLLRDDSWGRLMHNS